MKRVCSECIEIKLDRIMQELNGGLDEERMYELFVSRWAQGLELLVQNLSRLDEASSEDADGVHQTLGIVENLSEVSSPPPTTTDVAITTTTTTTILTLHLV